MGFLKDRYNEYGKGLQVTLSTFVETVKPRKLGGGPATKEELLGFYCEKDYFTRFRSIKHLINIMVRFL